MDAVLASLDPASAGRGGQTLRRLAGVAAHGRAGWLGADGRGLAWTGSAPDPRHVLPNLPIYWQEYHS